MVMVNISKSFYHLRRVSADGLANNIDLCGQETSNNYVVDTDAKEKNGIAEETYKSNYFIIIFFLSRQMSGKINSHQSLL